MHFSFHRACTNLVRAVLLFSLCGCVLSLPLLAQSKSDSCKDNHEPEAYANIRLVNATQQHESLDIQTDLRNMLPCARIYYVSSLNTISIQASQSLIEQARKIVAELDQPHKSYRITLTLAEVENGKHSSARKYSMVLWAGERSTLKLGQRVAIAVAADTKDKEADTKVQVQYMDVGLNFQATIEGKRLMTKVEELSIANSATPLQTPNIAQTVLENSSALKLGTPVTLGSLDLPGSVHRMEVEALVEAIE